MQLFKKDESMERLDSTFDMSLMILIWRQQ